MIYLVYHNSIAIMGENICRYLMNITRTTNNLEIELGCKLFIRSNKGIALIAEGKKLFPHVQAARG